METISNKQYGNGICCALIVVHGHTAGTHDLNLATSERASDTHPSNSTYHRGRLFDCWFNGCSRVTLDDYCRVLPSMLGFWCFQKLLV